MIVSKQTCVTVVISKTQGIKIREVPRFANCLPSLTSYRVSIYSLEMPIAKAAFNKLFSWGSSTSAHPLSYISLSKILPLCTPICFYSRQFLCSCILFVYCGYFPSILAIHTVKGILQILKNIKYFPTVATPHNVCLKSHLLLELSSTPEWICLNAQPPGLGMNNSLRLLWFAAHGGFL